MSARNTWWPVSEDLLGTNPTAWFSDYYAAVDFVTANLGVRNLYIGESRDLPRQAEQFTEVHGDPMLKRRRA